MLRHERTDSNHQPRRQFSISERDDDIHSLYSSSHTRTRTTSTNYSIPPEKYLGLSLKIDGVADYPIDEESSAVQVPKPKSPGIKLSSFFGWKPRQSSVVSDTPTTFSDRSSPVDSPMFARRNNDVAKPAPSALDIPKANHGAQDGFFNIPGTPLMSNSPGINAHVEELERELKHISSELAESIRREMELEDEVERIRAELPISATENKRTSDYYSDSGASSVRYPFSDNESKLDELEKQRRKAEQEKAQIKMDMAQRLQEELRRRRDLEAQVITLEEQLNDGQPPVAANSGDRVRELEAQLKNVQQRLMEERQMKENFEDLLAALKMDLEQYRNERDNLHDEVVPQLRARVEGLEAKVAESERLTYENARMQQEIQALKSENGLLAKSKRLSTDGGRFMSIAEEEESGSPAKGTPRIGLSRSNSLARSSGIISRGRAPSVTGGSLSRSNSVKERVESKESLSERLKDVEEQRDALHKALKNLLERQDVQAKEHAKRVRVLETELAKAFDASPRRRAFHDEVKGLRDEVNHLRRRADDALEQKYHAEKGLGGLRMDLDRAEQETSALRGLLKEHDIFVAERKNSNPNIQAGTSVNLNKAYQELKTTHALSLARVKQMEDGDSISEAGSEVQLTLNLLKQSISDAEAERDFAMKEADKYRQQARALQQSEMGHLAKEQSLASELFASATRMDELSQKVELQLTSNTKLRERLTEAITRGEEEQRKSAEKIVELERRLKEKEDKVMAAQQASEDALLLHEEEVKALTESQRSQLHRVRNGLVSPSMPKSPLFLKSPRLDKTSSGPNMSMAEATKTESLQKKVSELEKALSDADREMSEVVGRMNMAQFEVAELQGER